MGKDIELNEDVVFWKSVIRYGVRHWYTVIPATILFWPTLVSLIVGFETIKNALLFLVLPQFGTDMTGYEIMEIMVRKHAIEEGLIE